MVVDIYASNLFLYLARFNQPDTLTPGGPQGLNRFSYANNNPLNYNDPTGHCVGAGGHEFPDGSPACNPVASKGYGDPCAEAGYTAVNYGIVSLVKGGRPLLINQQLLIRTRLPFKVLIHVLVM